MEIVLLLPDSLIYHDYHCKSVCHSFVLQAYRTSVGSFIRRPLRYHGKDSRDILPRWYVFIQLIPGYKEFDSEKDVSHGGYLRFNSRHFADPALMESADHPLFQDIAMWLTRSRLLVSGLHLALY